MALPAATEQILAAYKQGATAEEIAQDLGWDVVAVKMTISANAPKEQSLANPNVKKELTFSEDEYQRAKETMVSLLDSEIDTVKFKSAEFVINENKGRNDIESFAKGINITAIQQAIFAAREKADAARQRRLERKNTVTLEAQVVAA